MNALALRHRASLVAALVVTAASAALPVAGAAQSLYTCRDQSGRTITSDRPIFECAGVMRELGPSGVVRREIAPPLTAEQQRQKEIDDKAKRIADDAVREKRRRDLALLTAYQSEDQIELARRRALLDANESIQTSQERVAELQKEKQSLAAEAATYRTKALPPTFKRRIDDNQALIDDEEAAVRMRRSDVDRINQRYDDDLRRFRELNVAARTPRR